MKAFFVNAQQLASLFTYPVQHNPERDGKYMEGGLKPVEAFCSDIRHDLLEWAVEGNSIFYKTTSHWYEFRLETEGEWKGVVWMTRFDAWSWKRMDSWANAHSVADVVGKAWLETQAHRRVPLFVTEKSLTIEG